MDGLTRFLLINENLSKIISLELCKLAQIKKLHTSPYCPETNGECECFNTPLINMLGTLPTHTKKMAEVGNYINECL